MKNKSTELYRCYDCHDDLIYVGISFQTLKRIRQHSRDAKWATRVMFIKIEHFDTRKEALEAEKQAIQNELPIFNIKLKKYAKLANTAKA